MENEYIKLLHATEIFSSLSQEKLCELYNTLEEINLNIGETLFKQGSPSDALYIVISGTLMVSLTLPSGGTQIIGVVHRGQTVGEAGLLSTQPRQMTIEALQNTKLLKLSKESFERVLKDEISPLIHIISLIVSRSQKTIQLLYKGYKYKGHLFIPADIHYDMTSFISRLKHENYKNIHFITISELQKKGLDSIHLSAYLESLEKEYDTIFYFMDVLNETIIDVVTEHSECLIILASGDKPFFYRRLFKKQINRSI